MSAYRYQRYLAFLHAMQAANWSDELIHETLLQLIKDGKL